MKWKLILLFLGSDSEKNERLVQRKASIIIMILISGRPECHGGCLMMPTGMHMALNLSEGALGLSKSGA